MSATLTTDQSLDVSGETETRWYKKEYFIGRAVKREEVMNFSRQAASFLRAGVPVLDALGVVAEESASKKMQDVLTDVQRRLRGGSSFGDAISVHTNVFPGYYIAVARAAELTGHLDDALDQLAEYLDRDLTARRQVKSSLTYPTIVMLLAVVAVVVMSVFVLPQFRDFYANLDAKLPLPTRMLLGFTDFLSTYWYLVIGGIVALALPIFAVFGGRHGKARRDATMLRLPMIGELVHLIAIERFCRVLATLVHGGRAAARRGAGVGRQHEQPRVPAQARDRARGDDARRRARAADHRVGHVSRPRRGR